MNTDSTIQTPSGDLADARAKLIQCLRDRMERLKMSAAESGMSDELRDHIQHCEKNVNKILNVHESEKNDAENGRSVEPEHLAAGQQADKGRTDPGQNPDTARTPSGQSADKSAQRSPLEKEIIEELNRSSQSPLDKLPPEEQERLYELISSHPIGTVHRVLCLPSPEGWGLSTSRQSLYRFRDRYGEQKQREYRKQQRSLAKSILEDLEGADDQFTDASERLFKLRLLETANNPASKTRDLRDLFTTLIRLRAFSKNAPRQNETRAS